VRHALYLPPFGPLADPNVQAEVAVEAEAHDWDGLFLWDHVLRPATEPAEIADVWVAMAAQAAVTERIRLGPMVTPIARRRPHKLAREILSLDQLSRGRLICGFGLGSDDARELSAFGEVTDRRALGDLLDEGADLVAELVAGEAVDHRGPHYTAADVTFRPRPVQQPRPPFWFAATSTAPRPIRRAARFEGIFPIAVSGDELGRIAELIVAVRGDLDGYDIAVVYLPGMDLAPFERHGATWAVHSFLPGATRQDVLDYLRIGPGQ
jgi:alkanesulfonate monooxygenase SsuD/methylene tetrahydromethanopterin reductase-like flavin-dependent oxidoreductase (luciferase family)